MAPKVPPAESFSLRLPKHLSDRMFSVIAATGNEIIRTGLIVRALEMYLVNLYHNPSMLEGYDIEQDSSAIRFDEMQDTK